MNRSELIQTLASKYNLKNGDAAETVRIVLEAIAESLANGDRVEIRGFGSFHAIHREAKIGRNPKTGASVVSGQPFHLEGQVKLSEYSVHLILGGHYRCLWKYLSNGGASIRLSSRRV